MGHFLTQIIQHKQQEIAFQKMQLSLDRLRAQSPVLARRDFVKAIRAKHQQQQPAVIAEIKKASPSKGVLREQFHPEVIANLYQAQGAACLSVLTDQRYFQGQITDLQHAKQACQLPVLRKDFIIDEYQIHQSHAMGADAVLLIVAALSETQLREFEALANTLQLSVLVEVHSQSELEQALRLQTPLIGINNRNLSTFETDLATSLALCKHIPDNKIVIAESGILTQEDVQRLSAQHIHTFLVGEAFMRAADPGQALADLFF